MVRRIFRSAAVVLLVVVCLILLVQSWPVLYRMVSLWGGPALPPPQAFRVLLDPQNMLGAQLQMPGIPTSYLLDKRGRIVYRKDGLHNWHTSAMRDLVDHLLAEEGGGTTP